MVNEHGKVAKGGSYRGCRWCTGCGHYHGFIYVCEHYSDSLRAEIAAEREMYRAMLIERARQELRDFGAILEPTLVFGAFAGLDLHALATGGDDGQDGRGGAAHERDIDTLLELIDIPDYLWDSEDREKYREIYARATTRARSTPTTEER